MKEKINEIGMHLYARDENGQVQRAPEPPSKALPNTINPFEGDPYDGAELRPFDGRPGAMDAFRLPSRGLV